jgi:hypothetical protein
MQKEIKTTDVSHLPDLLSLAEEVQSTRTPRVLTRGEHELAVLQPLGSPARVMRRSRARATSSDDPLWNIIGMADPYLAPDAPTDVAENVDRYLAEAYTEYDRHQP